MLVIKIQGGPALPDILWTLVAQGHSTEWLLIMIQIGKINPTVNLTLKILDTNALEFFSTNFPSVFINSNECKMVKIFLKWNLEGQISKNSGYKIRWSYHTNWGIRLSSKHVYVNFYIHIYEFALWRKIRNCILMTCFDSYSYFIQVFVCIC